MGEWIDGVHPEIPPQEGILLSKWLPALSVWVWEEEVMNEDFFLPQISQISRIELKIIEPREQKNGMSSTAYARLFRGQAQIFLGQIRENKRTGKNM